MKKLVPVLVVLAVLAAFLGTLGFLYERSRTPETVFKTETPFQADIVEKTVATGSIVPRNEVNIKPRVSGVVESIAVEPGDVVGVGDLIATVAIIPDSLALNNARAAISTAKISLDNAEQDLERSRSLSGWGPSCSASAARATTSAWTTEPP